MDDVRQFNYPFTAIVGQRDMLQALCLVAVEPRIGGVLISGERGTAKTTAVRALPQILASGSRVVELPLNATEDRVVGTLHVGTLMKTGEREFVPGVLAEADGHVLYVDEINLLEDHIVDLLLDAAATGVCRIEREGVSRTYPARFVLVGTMNPEEGSLRPQLLDRFGLSVKVSGDLSAEERLELVRRHVAFEQDPEGFCLRFAASDQALADSLAVASELYPHVDYPDDMAVLAAGICSEVGVDGYRADIVMMRAARAAAALAGRGEVLADDVFLAARFALPHRVKRLPFEDEVLSREVLDKAVQKQLALLEARGALGNRDAERPDERESGPGEENADCGGCRDERLSDDLSAGGGAEGFDGATGEAGDAGGQRMHGGASDGEGAGSGAGGGDPKAAGQRP